MRPINQAAGVDHVPGRDEHLSKEAAGAEDSMTCSAPVVRPNLALRLDRATQLSLEIPPLLALIALGVVVPVVIGILAGSLGIPRNDDWAYRRIAVDLARTGDLVLNVRTMIVGQIVAVQPLLWLSHLDPSAFVAAGIMFALAAVGAVYVLARLFLPRRSSVAVVVLLLLVPGYLAYATSFMSDLPALTAEMLCLALGAMALRGSAIQGRWLLLALIVGCAGISVRDFAIAAPAAVIVAALARHPRRIRYWAGVAVIGASYGVLTGVRSMFYATDQVVLPVMGGAGEALQGLSSLSLAMAPLIAVILIRGRRRWRMRHMVVGAELGGILLVGRLVFEAVTPDAPDFMLPNLFSRWGAPQESIALGVRPPLFDAWGWNAVLLVSALCGVALMAAVVGALGRRLQIDSAEGIRPWHGLGTPGGMLVIFTTAMLAGLAAYGTVNPLMDRYLWPVVPVLAIVLLRGSSVGPSAESPAGQAPIVTRLVVPSYAFVGALAILVALNSTAFDAALWHGGEDLVRLGLRPNTIDAGYDWVGYYATTPIRQTADTKPNYRGYWPNFRPCGLVVSGPARTGHSVVAIEGYRLFLVAGPEERLTLVRATNPDCWAPN